MFSTMGINSGIFVNVLQCCLVMVTIGPNQVESQVKCNAKDHCLKCTATADANWNKTDSSLSFENCFLPKECKTGSEYELKSTEICTDAKCSIKVEGNKVTRGCGDPGIGAGDCPFIKGSKTEIVSWSPNNTQHKVACTCLSNETTCNLGTQVHATKSPTTTTTTKSDDGCGGSQLTLTFQAFSLIVVSTFLHLLPGLSLKQSSA